MLYKEEFLLRLVKGGPEGFKMKYYEVLEDLDKEKL
jgi:hypothetical protein